MTTAPLPSSAQWIWRKGDDAPTASYVCFRRSFDASDPSGGTIRVTADARYEIYVNGTWLGHGPVRSWPSPWPVDDYDVRHLLVSGRNVIAVLVQQLGLSTFQYLYAKPGLLASIQWEDAAGKHELPTDARWRCHCHEGFAWHTPRIACQQGFEEQFDARISLGPTHRNWQEPEFDDSHWPSAVVCQTVGQVPHQQLEQRRIPSLTREPVSPTRVAAVEAVQPAPYTLSCHYRWRVNADDRTANNIRAAVLLATFVYSDKPQPIRLQQPHRVEAWKLNGQLLRFENVSDRPWEKRLAEGRLKTGWNVLLCKPSVQTHTPMVVVNLWTKHAVSIAATPSDRPATDSVWRMFGPFQPPKTPDDQIACIDPTSIHGDATLQRYEAIWEVGHVSEADLSAPFSHTLRGVEAPPVDVFAICHSEKPVDHTPQVYQPDALRHDNDEWTVINPNDHGDVRLLLDFSDELVGYHEFEVDAPAGTIIDNHNFEFIQRDNRYNLADGMNNSFRYLCRQGVQRYRTFIRRGFRYSWFTFRQFDRPIRVRFIRTIFNTYPTPSRGQFECADGLLERIWRTGVHSVRCCAEDTYTDCPSYEQTLWVGDARNEALVDLIASGDPRLSEHCWITAARSLERSPIVESHVPSGWHNILPAWSFLWMRWAQEHYLLTGDEQFAQNALPWLDRNVQGIREHLNDQGLFAMSAWNMFDWADMDTPYDGVITHLNCQAVSGLRQTADLAKRLKDSARAKGWHRLADELTDAINTTLWSPRRRAYYDCLHADGNPSKVFSQQTQTAAYLSGVATGQRGQRCRRIIDKAPSGFVKAGSPFYMFFVLETLANEGRSRELIDTIRNYWGPQIAEGATTFWEMYHPDAPRKTRSHCHGWSAAPTYFLSAYVLGVRPLTPGYGKVLVAPQPGDIEWAQGRVPTPHGIATVYWKNTPKQFDLKLTLPPKTPACIELPVPGRVKTHQGKLTPARASVDRPTFTTRSNSLHLVVER